MSKLVTYSSILTVIFVSWIASFASSEEFKSMTIVPELVPDLWVSYNCDKFVEMKDIQMIDKGAVVDVNYGGFGRHRKEPFKCLDK